MCVFTIAGNGSNGNVGEELVTVWEGGGEETYRKEAYKEKKERKERMCSPTSCTSFYVRMCLWERGEDA